MLKKYDQLPNLMFLFFPFLCSNVPDNKCHKPKWCVLFFTLIKLVACVLACVHAIAHIKWRRLRMGEIKFTSHSRTANLALYQKNVIYKYDESKKIGFEKK